MNMDNPMLRDIREVFYSDRLMIRVPRAGDGQAVFESLQASAPELTPWMPFMKFGPTLESTEANLRESVANFILRKDMRLLVFSRDGSVFIGSSGLHHIDWSVPKFEIGYWIDTRQARQGYMTEAVERITRFAFEDLGARRVQICCDAANARSRAIPERLGYALEATQVNWSRSHVDDSLTDHLVFSRTSWP